MSVTALTLPTSRRPGRLGQVALTVGAIAAVFVLVSAIAGYLAPAAPPPSRNPFGMGLSEAAPAATAFGRFIMALQSRFYGALTGALAALKADGAVWPLVGLGFAYGVFHAAGPGHGKAVISAYIVSSERALRLAVALSFAAALVQSLVAIGLVLVVFVLVGGTARTMAGATAQVEFYGFLLVGLVGLVMAWRKAGSFLGLRAMASGRIVAGAATCGHAHLPPPEKLDRVSGARAWLGIALAAGIRPCAGAILLLGLALAQKLVAAGILAVLAMGFGTAITTSAVATIAVFAKRLALRLAGGRGLGAALAVAGLELAAAALVAVIGLSLVTGLSLGEGGI